MILKKEEETKKAPMIQQSLILPLFKQIHLTNCALHIKEETLLIMIHLLKYKVKFILGRVYIS